MSRSVPWASLHFNAHCSSCAGLMVDWSCSRRGWSFAKMSTLHSGRFSAHSGCVWGQGWLVALLPSMTACCSSDVAMHLHCAHTHRMLQATCTQCATKRGGLENVVGRTFIAFARVSGRSSGGRSWNMTFHLVISISTSFGEGNLKFRSCSQPS